MQFKYLWFALIALSCALSSWLAFVWSTVPTRATYAASAEHQMLVLATLIGIVVFLLLSGTAGIWSWVRGFRDAT